MKKNDSRPDEKEKTMSETNGDKHNLIPDSESWTEDAKNDMEDYIEEHGVHIRQ